MTRLRQRAAARSCSARIFPQRPSDGRHGRCRRGSSAPAEPAVEGFRLLRTQTLRKTITLSSNEDVQALFLMTPYYYKTGAEDQQKLAAVPSLRVTTEFLIAVCQKP